MMCRPVDLCIALTPAVRCVRATLQQELKFAELLHEHFPRHRINAATVGNFLRALMCQFLGVSAQGIARSYLNNRKGEPRRSSPRQTYTYCLESGILRTMCTSNHHWV